MWFRVCFFSDLTLPCLCAARRDGHACTITRSREAFRGHVSTIGDCDGDFVYRSDGSRWLGLFAQPVFNAPDYLTKIAANEPTVLATAFLVFIMGWAGAGIGISMYPILRRHNEGLALGAAGFRIIEGVFHCIGAVLILLLATLSREFVKAGPADLAQLQNLGTLLAEARVWVRDVAALPAWCIGAFLYYALFYKTRLVPRWLSVWGLVGLSLTVASSILVLFRQLAPMSTVHLLMNLPIFPQEMVLAVWLIVKGFNRSAIAAPLQSAS